MEKLSSEASSNPGFAFPENTTEVELPLPKSSSWGVSLPRWRPTSHEDLIDAETKVLSAIEEPFEQMMVKIGDNVHINTLKMGRGPPLVLLHGFGAGVGFWVCNLLELSKHHTVYAIDLPGFGRSSRAPFTGTTPEEAETFFLNSLEQWRKAMDLDRFTLLGHSFGAYLSSVYALQHPSRVDHLLLADPWGVPRKPDISTRKTTFFWKFVTTAASHMNPLSIIRVLGPFGPGLIERFRRDINDKFTHLYEHSTLMTRYIYHLNAQEPSGESAFHTLTLNGFWAQQPLKERLHKLHPDIPVTFMYGSFTWMDTKAGKELTEILGDRADFHIIDEAGHHIYVDNHLQFNDIVISSIKKWNGKLNMQIEHL
jgi:pimeloyl-ACP methyl ester carboxylesterase